MEYAHEIFRWCSRICLGCKCTFSMSFEMMADGGQRLNWTSQVQLYAVIALAALALWFLFDRTVMGMAVSSVVGIGSWVGFMLIITP
jgi:hypothetical protein